MEAALVEDWARDRAGAARLDYSRLFSAVFELADHWSAGIGAEQYAALLDALALAVGWRLRYDEGRDADCGGRGRKDGGEVAAANVAACNVHSCRGVVGYTPCS